MFGYGKQEVLGKTPGILHRSAEAETLAREIIEGMERNGRWAGETTFVHKDGLAATIGVDRDISERSRLEGNARRLVFTWNQTLRSQGIELNALICGRMDLLGRALGGTTEIKTSSDSVPLQPEVNPGQLEKALLNLAIHARDAISWGRYPGNLR